MSTPQFEKLVQGMIYAIGDDPQREELKDTPARVVKSWSDLFAGYKMEGPREIIKVFQVSGINYQQDLVQVSNIRFTSFCEHHLLPFFGTVNVSYRPDRNIRIGLSKIPRLVEYFSKRLQVQERMTHQICEALFASDLIPLCVDVVTKARHFCIECRGVAQPDTVTTCRSTLTREEYEDEENE